MSPWAATAIPFDSRKGVTFGLPPTLTALAAYRELLALENCDMPWFSAVVGGDLIETPVARATVEQYRTVLDAKAPADDLSCRPPGPAVHGTGGS